MESPRIGGHSSPPAFVRRPEHLLDFVDTASVGLHWVGPDGTILWANPADYEPLGYSADEYIGRNIAEFHVDPDVIADILSRLSGGERLNNYEARLRCKDGSIRHVQITSSVLFEQSESGREFVHTRCYTQDITDRKRLEQARDRFVSILGHDLRNPLSAIAVAVDQLRKAPDIGEAHKRTIERVGRSADRMSRMIEDLIDFARGLGHAMPVRREAVDFGEICGRIVDETRQAYPDSQIELDMNGDLRGAWDAGRVGQAISNLIANAVQHGEPPVTVRLRGEPGAVLLEVSNRGTPISPESVRDIFEPYSHTAGSAGLGLGLFIVSQIVAAHGGTVDVRSSAAEGTTFTSRWPRM